MSELATSSKKKGPKHSRRLRVAANLIAAYLNLGEDSRDQFEQFLALQVYGDAGMGFYGPTSSSRPVESDMKHFMYEHIRESLHEAWFKWAQMIKKAHLSEFERREAVRDMLGGLIQQKNRNFLNESELREAAEKTLDWTRWDERYHAQLRAFGFKNSSEYKNWLKELASGKHREGPAGHALQF